MQPDRVLTAVARKELQLFFASPVAWLFLASFMAVCLFTFFWVEAFFARNIADVRPLFEWMPLLLIFLSAALTMRSWSEERRSGTLEHVLTLPVPLWQFVVGKFPPAPRAGLALAATLPLPSPWPPRQLDWGPVLAGYLAAFLLGCELPRRGPVRLLAHGQRHRQPDRQRRRLRSALPGGQRAAGRILRRRGGGDAAPARLRGALREHHARRYRPARPLLLPAVTVAFLALNVYGLERGRWASGPPSPAPPLALALTLLLANLVAGGLWLHRCRHCAPTSPRAGSTPCRNRAAPC
jgi:ABC-2 type transport system permease protein